METPHPARIADVAAAAGVSTATVDRVLNGRPNVRAVTKQRVLAAAAELRYLPETDLLRSLQPAPMALAFLLPAGTNPYLKMLGDYIGYEHDALAPFNVHCRSVFVDSFDPAMLAAALKRHGRDAAGIAFMAIEHPLVRDAVDRLSARGVHVVTLISDLPGSKRAGYVGLDNRAAGRTVGLLMGRFLGPRKGKVAMIAGSLSYRGHEEREMGFLHVMRESFPQLKVVGVREGRDDAATNHRLAHGLLEQHPDLIGLYNIGGASDGVARALKEAQRDQKVVFIGHGLTPDTRSLLIDGTLDAVITQHQQASVLNCVRIFTNLRDGREPLTGVDPVGIQIVLRENLP